MKLNEIFDADEHEERLDVFDTEPTNKKRERAKMRLKLLRAKADRRNRKTPKADMMTSYANHDGMVGHPTTFQGFINGATG